MKTTKRLLTIFIIAIMMLTTLAGCSKTAPKITHILKDDMVSIYTTRECLVRVAIKVATDEVFEKDVKVSPDAVTVVGIDDIIPSSYSRYLKETGNDTITSVSIEKTSSIKDLDTIILALLEIFIILCAIIFMIIKLKNRKRNEKEEEKNKKPSTTKKK